MADIAPDRNDSADVNDGLCELVRELHEQVIDRIQRIEFSITEKSAKSKGSEAEIQELRNRLSQAEARLDDRLFASDSDADLGSTVKKLQSVLNTSHPILLKRLTDVERRLSDRVSHLQNVGLTKTDLSAWTESQSATLQSLSDEVQALNRKVEGLRSSSAAPEVAGDTLGLEQRIKDKIQSAFESAQVLQKDWLSVEKEKGKRLFESNKLFLNRYLTAIKKVSDAKSDDLERVNANFETCLQKIDETAGLIASLENTLDDKIANSEASNDDVSAAVEAQGEIHENSDAAAIALEESPDLITENFAQISSTVALLESKLNESMVQVRTDLSLQISDLGQKFQRVRHDGQEGTTLHASNAKFLTAYKHILAEQVSREERIEDLLSSCTNELKEKIDLISERTNELSEATSLTFSSSAEELKAGLQAILSEAKIAKAPDIAEPRSRLAQHLTVLQKGLRHSADAQKRILNEISQLKNALEQRPSNDLQETNDQSKQIDHFEYNESASQGGDDPRLSESTLISSDAEDHTAYNAMSDVDLTDCISTVLSSRLSSDFDEEEMKSLNRELKVSIAEAIADQIKKNSSQ